MSALVAPRIAVAQHDIPRHSRGLVRHAAFRAPRHVMPDPAENSEWGLLRTRPACWQRTLGPGDTRLSRLGLAPSSSVKIGSTLSLRMGDRWLCLRTVFPTWDAGIHLADSARGQGSTGSA